ncbi:flagellar biosynthesis repressor FlbT [Leisingera sp. XS_AS12]|uniref:flagellar biosynthesis repressor FlbT n=1 Tax=Leisingera sp. XS_AS12 TaxID=3241294 RepID=UPI0035119E15
MGLVLKVKAGDRLVINGAVLRNIGKSQMVVEVENRSDVLRGEEILGEAGACTPVRRLCHMIQLAMVSREGRGKILPRIHAAFEDLSEIMAKSHGSVLSEALTKVGEDNFYAAYRLLLPVIKYEDELLAIAARTGQEGSGS